jgi:hypothetical protein
MNDYKVASDSLAGTGTKEIWIIGAQGGSAYNPILYVKNPDYGRRVMI